MEVHVIVCLAGGWITTTSFATNEEATKKAAELNELDGFTVHGPILWNMPDIQAHHLPLMEVANEEDDYHFDLDEFMASDIGVRRLL